MGEQCEAEAPAEMLERESGVFLVLFKGSALDLTGVLWHTCTHTCAPIHTLHLVSIIKIGAGCQLCHSLFYSQEMPGVQGRQAILNTRWGLWPYRTVPQLLLAK